MLRRFDFQAIRAKAAPVKAFKRTPGTFTKRKLVFKDGATVIAVEGAPALVFQVVAAFKRSTGRLSSQGPPRVDGVRVLGTARDTRARGTSACDASIQVLRRGGCVIGRSRGATICLVARRRADRSASDASLIP